MPLRTASFVGVLLALVLLPVMGCRDEDLVEPDINRPPETVLSVAPQQGGRVFHKYLVRWTGLDEDGVVVGYRIATVVEDELYGGRTSEEDIAEYLLDLPWQMTDATESLFVFRADRPNTRNHSLYVIAVDNEGKEDPSPALTNFVAIDYGLPWIDIRISDNIRTEPRKPPATGDTLPAYNLANPDEPITIRISWTGDDPDGEILEWRHRLDSSVEQAIEAVKELACSCATDLGVEPCSCYVGLAEFRYDPNDPAGSDVWIGFHEFRLSAIDDANARSEQKTARFIINYDPVTMIDSVWSFRSGKAYSDPLPDMLIFASDWRTNPDSAQKYAHQRVGYHFGQLKMKFHAWDKDKPVDGQPPSEFKWSIKGTLLKSSWVSNACGVYDTIDYYCDETPKQPYLDSDRPFTLIASSRDNHGKADGNPDTIMFEVNYTPEILGINSEVTNPNGIDVRISWETYDLDEGYGWGTAQGDLEQALMKYRYRYRETGSEQWSLWETVTSKDRNRRYNTFATITGLDPGAYDLELQVYNGDYIKTRSVAGTHTFTIP
jgi:hypothetical protein